MRSRVLCCVLVFVCLAAGVGSLCADEQAAAEPSLEAPNAVVATVGRTAEAGTEPPEATTPEGTPAETIPTASTDQGTEASPGKPPELKLALDVTIVTAVSVEVLKRTIRDPRPYGEGHAHGYGYGFPSGDATLAFALARVASEYHPKQRTLWYLLAARVAWSRVKREAHDWQDVIGGAALGTWIGENAVRNGGIVLKTWEW
jgi:hypothetical protein